MSWWAANTTLATSAAMVMGPTPPGTGVMADATHATSRVATSPTTQKPASARLIRMVACVVHPRVLLPIEIVIAPR
jgi:hypothetical protein